ncbi:YraN family protein [Jannaschia sp. S6380]|uniref:YraN family protein n=1 Tax=Jannaschia sp. S6380 TaxID=2926408 RepID=UPI001FF5BA9A|nr:YraN family protein [Jannaschia sp. S6380]MCK0168087.1 YraN family protein [Jannaschia sp. S6380]
MSGTTSYHAGLAAEDSVARYYERAGHDVLARRWRGKGGEIDVIVQDGPDTVFVEVKKSDTHAAAALRVSERQIHRLFDCAGEYMGTLPDGMNAAVRFDVALVDGVGRIEIVENALSA